MAAVQSAEPGLELGPVVRSVLGMAAEGGLMSHEELEEVASSTIEGQSRDSLERLAQVALRAALMLREESRRRGPVHRA